MESTLQWNTKTKVEFLRKLPGRDRLAESLGFRPEKVLVLHDKRLAKLDFVRKWLVDFSYSYPVSASEDLKDLKAFPRHVHRVTRLLGPFSPRSMAIVGLGGSSLNEFAGFIASVLKRGVPFVQIPSTLLSALDSAHGGKTGLNVDGIKNHIGTFYPAESVMIVKALFEGLAPAYVQSACGELVKMALLKGGDLYEKVANDFRPDFEPLWDLLPSAIQAKYEFVEKDPFERGGDRLLLNLGHSLGHALESYFDISHGLAVGEGLIFAVQWSAHQGYLRDPAPLISMLQERAGFLNPRAFAKKFRPMSRPKLAHYLSADKKLTDSRHMEFVFLEGLGKPFRKVVTLDSFLTETQRQGWTAV